MDALANIAAIGSSRSNTTALSWEEDGPKCWRGAIRRRRRQIARRTRSRSTRPAAPVSIAFELDAHRLVAIDETLRDADRFLADVDAHPAQGHFLE